MSNAFDADAFGLVRITLNGVEYSFRPASVKLYVEYINPVMSPKLQTAELDEQMNIMIELIRKVCPDIPEEDLRSASRIALPEIFKLALHGAEEDEKNS